MLGGIEQDTTERGHHGVLFNMKYIYINTTEDRITATSNKIIDDLEADDTLTRFDVTDDFDMTKEVESGVFLEGFLTPTEFHQRRNSDYKQARAAGYPSVEDQLDYIYHNGLDAWKTNIIQPIKDANQKP